MARAASRKVHSPISAPRTPKVPKSLRVPDGMNQQTFDSLQNIITGMGTSRDKMTGNAFVFTELDIASLEAAYRSDWIARKVVDIPAQDATREWRTWQSDKQDIGLIETLEKDLQVQKKVKQAMQKARLYGGGALLIGVNSGSMEQELIAENVKKDSLKFLHVVSRWELSGGEIDWDINSEYYGTPKYYTRAQTGTNVQNERIHPSRVVRFTGSEVPNVRLTNGWGDSVLQVVNDAIQAAGTVAGSGTQLMNELKMDVIKIPDLAASLSHKEYSDRLNNRFALANSAKSLYSILLLDKEEEWQRITANLNGLPDVLKMYLLIASGAADIPATRMLGQSPAGLSATGDSDLRNYYDHVKSVQNTDLSPAMKNLDEIIIRSATGTGTPEDIVYVWPPLWQIEEQIRSTIIQQKAASFQVDVTAGLIPSEVLRDARINQLIEDGVYPGLEQILDDYGPLDPIDDNPAEGSVIGPDGQPIPPTDPAHPNNQPILDPKTGKPKVDPKTGQPMTAANSNLPLAVKAVGDMAKRIRRASSKKKSKYRMMDGVLRTLYVYRPVVNAAEIVRWAKAQGIPNVEPAAELHTTIIWSRTPVDWSKTGEPWGSNADGGLDIRAGGMRVLQKFGNAIVLCFNSSELGWRHCQLKDAGATYDYDEYQPHITLAYLGEDDPTPDLTLQAFNGAIKLGPEVYAEANGSYTQDYNENHDPKNGQFSEGKGGGSGSAGKGSVHKAVTSMAKGSRLENSAEYSPEDIAHAHDLSKAEAHQVHSIIKALAGMNSGDVKNVVKAYTQIVKGPHLEDRLQYSPEDLAQMYGLNKEEASTLHTVLQHHVGSKT